MNCLAVEITNKGAKRCPLRAKCKLYQNAIKNEATKSDIDYKEDKTCTSYVDKNV